MAETVQYRVEGRVARITMNRAEKRNALDASLIRALHLAFDTAEQEEGVRVVVLTGEGKAFSAGADLEELQASLDWTAEERTAHARKLGALYERIYRFPKPVIARINGHALGGGCGLALVCDFSIATETARLGFTEVRIGFVPALVSIFVLRKLGESLARDLLLRGRQMSAVEAASIGLVTRMVGLGELDTAVEELAFELAREVSPSSTALTKRAIAEVQSLGLSDAILYAAGINAEARATDDCRAGIRAFLNNSEPPWRN